MKKNRQKVIILAVVLMIIFLIWYRSDNQRLFPEIFPDPDAYDPNLFNYIINPATGDAIYGCTDPVADNYEPTATHDHNCLYMGCQDITASNYNPQANIGGNGLCDYDG